MDGEQEYWDWLEKFDVYLSDKKYEIEYDYRLKPREREKAAAYTEWAVNLLGERFIDICQPLRDPNVRAFEILEDFMFEMLTYRKAYGQDKGNKTMEFIFDCAVDVAEEIAMYYFFIN